MPVNPTYPGIYIEELPSAARTITAAPTSITVFLGYTHPFKTRDPSKSDDDPNASNFGKPIRIFNFSDYERMFGGLFHSDCIDNSVAYAVQQFFLNGGADAYVVGLEPKIWSNGTATDYLPAEVQLSAGFKLQAREPTDAMTMTVTLSNASSNVADITISYGKQVETYRGVSIDASDAGKPSHIETQLQNSKLVKVVNLNASGAYSITSEVFPSPTLPAGASTYDSSDFTDALESSTPLDKIDIFNLMVIPGVVDNLVLTKAQVFCEQKRAFLIMDAPANYKVNDLVNDLGNQKEMVADIPTSPNAALYLPYLKTIDPIGGDIIDVPPSGFIAGIFARTDTNRGVWKAPAGLETVIKNTTGVDADGRMTDMQAGVLNKNMINAIRTFPGVGTVTFGARTYIGSNPAFDQWRYVPVRRMALFIEQTLYSNLGWVVFEPNDEPLWAAIRTSIERFMLSLFKQGAFQGSKPSDAFLVKCDSSTTTQFDIDSGRVNILVGFRPLKPAEFVVVQITQLAGQAQA